MNNYRSQEHEILDPIRPIAVMSFIPSSIITCCGFIPFSLSDCIAAVSLILFFCCTILMLLWPRSRNTMLLRRCDLVPSTQRRGATWILLYKGTPCPPPSPFSFSSPSNSSYLPLCCACCCCCHCSHLLPPVACGHYQPLDGFFYHPSAPSTSRMMAMFAKAIALLSGLSTGLNYAMNVLNNVLEFLTLVHDILDVLKNIIITLVRAIRGGAPRWIPRVSGCCLYESTITANPFLLGNASVFWSAWSG
jgi:hypothetical protein